MSKKPFIIIDDIETLQTTSQTTEIHATDVDALKQFLRHYTFSADTFQSYRRDSERFLLWLSLIQGKTLYECRSTDITDYIKFFNQPPSSWTSCKRVQRCKDGKPNPDWKPFVTKKNMVVSQNTIKSMLAILSTFFAFCVDQEHVMKNPVSSLKQKRQYSTQQQTHIIRKISKKEWNVIINIAHSKRVDTLEAMRGYYVLTLFYLLGVRISEVSVTERSAPCMKNFYQDSELNWWFQCLGKGNKVRDVAVPEQLLDVLKEFRQRNSQSPLPAPDDNYPLIPKIKGHGGCGVRQVRNILQKSFNEAIAHLHVMGDEVSAKHLEHATAHWLRHTAISHDVESRPLEHVRDDVGHGNIKTTSHYITTDRDKRHESAKDKSLGI